MYEFKVVITASESVINNFLDQGWSIVSVTAQYLATGRGEFCFVLKK